MARGAKAASFTRGCQRRQQRHGVEWGKAATMTAAMAALLQRLAGHRGVREERQQPP